MEPGATTLRPGFGMRLGRGPCAWSAIATGPSTRWGSSAPGVTFCLSRPTLVGERTCRAYWISVAGVATACSTANWMEAQSVSPHQKTVQFPSFIAPSALAK